MSEEWIKYYTRECVKGMGRSRERGWRDLIILLVVSVIIGVMI